MTLVKEAYVAFNPVHISLLGADRVVQDPDARTDLVQQAQRRWCGRCLTGPMMSVTVFMTLWASYQYMYTHTVSEISKLRKPTTRMVVAPDGVSGFDRRHTSC